jgi:phosphatidylinositol phospholipase C, delta
MAADEQCFLVPAPSEHSGESYHAYVRVQLFHESGEEKWSSKAVKVKDVPEKGADIIWDGSFEWEIWADELAFLRYALPPSYTPSFD